MQIDVGYIIVLILGLTVLDYLIDLWPAYNIGLSNKTPTSVTIANCSSKYYTVPRMSSWKCIGKDMSYGREPQTPMKYLSSEQRVRLISGVRRRLDKQF